MSDPTVRTVLLSVSLFAFCWSLIRYTCICSTANAYETEFDTSQTQVAVVAAEDTSTKVSFRTRVRLQSSRPSCPPATNDRDYTVF